MFTITFFIITGIIVFSYITDQILSFLNTSHRNKNIPPELEGIYTPEKYRESQEYGKANDKFSFITDTFTTILTLTMLAIGGFAIVNNFALSISNNPILSGIIFFGILVFVSDLINTPFSLYSIFVIEEKFGFNKTTWKTFITDKIKGWLLGALVGGALLAGIIWFYNQTADMFWIYTWITITGFSIFMMMFYSTLIVPLFNKQSPLEEGDLKEAIKDFSIKAGFKLDNIFVIDGSKRSTKANAYFSGIGAKKRIVLYDTLIKDLTTSEIVAVLAHEIGHYKKKHTLSGIFISIIQTGITLYILSLFISMPQLSEALGSNEVSFQLGLIAFGILYTPISIILGIFTNLISRKNEYEADRFAKEHGCSESLISGLKKLTEKNLSNLTPHPANVFLHYSHPTLLQRIRAIN